MSPFPCPDIPADLRRYIYRFNLLSTTRSAVYTGDSFAALEQPAGIFGLLQLVVGRPHDHTTLQFRNRLGVESGAHRTRGIDITMRRICGVGFERLGVAQFLSQ